MTYAFLAVSVGVVNPISLTRIPRLKEMKELALSTKEGRRPKTGAQGCLAASILSGPYRVISEHKGNNMRLCARSLSSSWALASSYPSGP